VIARRALLLAVLAACGAPRPVPTAGQALRYRVIFDASLREVEVELRGALPPRLVPIHAAGEARFEAAWSETGPLAGPVIEVPDGARFVRYRVRLAGGGGDPDAPMTFPRAVYAPTSAWLWAPEPRDPTARYPLELVLPEGAGHSALFTHDPETGTLSFGEAAFRYVSYAAFGALGRFAVPAPGGCLEVAALPGSPPEAALRAWLTATGDAASRALGRLPHESVAVIALPLPGFGGDPVAFGMAAHGERPTLLAYVDRDATAEALRRDWVAVHELSHLGHAFLDGESAWLTEGIATYYETVLRARAGWVSAETAVAQLDGGFRRGERGGTGRTLREESEDRHRTRAYDRVYWAGAAIALAIDVALRGEGSSLDAALLRAHDLRSERLDDEALLRALDGGRPGTATRVAAPWLDASAFPDLGPAYRALGVRREGAGVALDAEGGALRTEILTRSPPLAATPAASCR
jgi:hypothetical protein